MQGNNILQNIIFLTLIINTLSFLDYTHTHEEGDILKIGIGQLKMS